MKTSIYLNRYSNIPKLQGHLKVLLGRELTRPGTLSEIRIAEARESYFRVHLYRVNSQLPGEGQPEQGTGKRSGEHGCRLQGSCQ